MSERTRLRLLGSPDNVSTLWLAEACRARGVDAELVPGTEAYAAHRPGDVVVGRLDVLPTLDGVEPGLLALLLLERRGARVLNRAGPLLAAHDKLRSARALAAAGVPQPATELVRGRDLPALPPPLVLKPRFGSWGQDVHRCDDEEAVARRLDELRGRSWFRRQGCLAQELLPPLGHDLRVVVAAGRVVGSIARVAAPGEWRTNASLGGSLRHEDPPPDAAELAAAAAAAVGADLIGVDLSPLPGGGHVVLELNGAVEFDERYSLAGRDVYDDVVEALCGRDRAAALARA